MTSSLKGLVRGTTLDRLLKIFQSEGEVVSESALLEELTAEEILEIELAPEVFLPIIATTVLMSPTARNKINQLVRETIARNPDRVREERKTDDQLAKKFTNAVNNSIRRNRIRFADPVRREETGADDPPIPLEDIPVPTEIPSISRPTTPERQLTDIPLTDTSRSGFIRSATQQRTRQARRLPRGFRRGAGLVAGLGAIGSATANIVTGTTRQRLRPIIRGQPQPLRPFRPRPVPPPPTQPPRVPPPPTQPPPTPPPTQPPTPLPTPTPPPTQPPTTLPPPTPPPTQPPITTPSTRQTTLPTTAQPQETFDIIHKENIRAVGDLRPEFVSVGTNYFEKTPLEKLEEDIEWIEFDYVKPLNPEGDPFNKLDDDKIRFMEPLFLPELPPKEPETPQNVFKETQDRFRNVIDINNEPIEQPRINIGFTDIVNNSVIPNRFNDLELYNP